MSDDAGLKVFLFEQPDGHGKWNRLAAWKRTAIVDGATVFLPAALIGSETAAWLAAGYDGTPCVMHLGHPFLPADWLARENPKLRASIEKACLSIGMGLP